MALWDSPRQREAYDWFATELANLRTAFRWAADHGDLDVAAAIATYAMLLGGLVENYEPIAWAEELIEPARALDHPRLAALYVNVAQCYWTGRIEEEAVGYADAGQTVICTGRGEVPFGLEGALGGVYMAIGQPERSVEWCRAQLARGRDTHTLTRSMLVIALVIAGAGEEARAAANGLIEAAEATHNPVALAYALNAYGGAFRDADPVRALEALRRGLVIAQDSGNRLSESIAGDRFVSDLRPNTATRWPRSITSLWSSATATTLATSPTSVAPWQLSRSSSTASDASNRQPPSPVSHSVPSPRRQSPNSAQ